MKFTLNGQEVDAPNAAPDTPLLYVLRNDMQLNGPKFGCGLGECGACAVLIDGKVARSCSIPLNVVAGKKVTTLEVLSPDASKAAQQQAQQQAQQPAQTQGQTQAEEQPAICRDPTVPDRDPRRRRCRR